MNRTLYTTALADDFLTAYARIPRGAQKKVAEFTRKFRENPTSSAINYEKLASMRDPRLRSVRVGIDYRAIVLAPEQGNVYVLLWVDHHDEAYTWAKDRRVEVHPETGALQVFRSAEEAVASIDQARATVPKGTKPPSGRFAEFDDRTLVAAGIPAALLPAVRAVYTDGDLEALSPHLPPEAAEVLTGLAAGFSLDEALEQVLGEPTVEAPKTIDTDDLAAALDRPHSGRRFRVMDADFDLEAALSFPLDRWRVFLHPTQKSLVSRDYKGPMRVLGGAGTGKTVVAMHRAVWLARHRLGEHETLLFTAFNKNLARDIRDQLTKLATDEELRRIRVDNIDGLAAEILKESGERARLARGSQARDLLDEAVNVYGDGPWDASFYASEWRDVVQAQAIRKESEYLRARRIGRGTRLTKMDRKKVWQVFAYYQEQLLDQGLMEAQEMRRVARKWLESKSPAGRFAAVVVDETQDMGPEALTLIRALAGPEHANDLFLVGDAHQRIYDRGASLSSCGINVRGRRSRRLRVNYRTTDAIRRFALRALEGEQYDDLDEGQDDLKGHVSLRFGPAPVVRTFDSTAEERAFLVQEIGRRISDGVSPEDICVTARTHEWLESVYGPALRSSGIPFTEIGATGASSTGVRLATMHRVKGLEFPIMFVAGVNRGIVPLETAELTGSDKVIAAAARKRERCLLYVATSRARDELYVTASGVPSEFLSTRLSAP